MDNALVDKIKAQLYDRASSPVLIAFFVSWVTWNIRTVLVIFTKGALSDKFKAIDSLYPSLWSYPLQGVLYPALCALLFVAIYPYLAHLAFWHWQKEHVKIKRTQQRIEDETPATQDEINALRKASLTQVASLQSEIREAYELIKEYKARENEVSAQNVKLNAHITSLDETMKSKNLELSTIGDEYIKLKTEIQYLQQIIDEQKNSLLAGPSSESEKNYLNDLVPKSSVLKDSNEAIKVFKKIKSTSDFKELTDEQIEMIMQLAINDGKVRYETLKDINSHLSEIEFDFCIDSLRRAHQVISIDSSNVYLTAQGKQLIVNGGIAKFTNDFKKELKNKVLI